MPYEIATADDYADLLDRVRRFAGGFGILDNVSFTGDGAGVIEDVDTQPGTLTETITVECTAAAFDDNGTIVPAEFSVTGSAGGAYADYTEGDVYDEDVVTFRIPEQGTENGAYSVGDSFSIETTQGELAGIDQAWAVIRWEQIGDVQGFPQHELVMRGPGTSGDDAIYHAWRSLPDPDNDRFNWRLWGFVDWIGGAIEDQPGNSSAGRYLALWQNAIPYWLVANGRRIVLVAKVSNVYQSGYWGFYLPYGTPEQFPYPIITGGSTNTNSRRWSDQVDNHRMWPKRFSRFRHVDGTWYNVDWDSSFSPAIFPFADENNANLFYSNLRESPDETGDGGGFWPLIPLILTIRQPSPNVLGELEGCFYTTGFDNSAENIMEINGEQYVAFIDVYRAGFHDFWALRLS